MITKKGVFGIVQGHQNRHLVIDPKTGELFVGVGSSGNLGVEPEPKATIQRFNADGSNQTTFASGTRNPTALAFNPESGDLYALVQERDGLGDGLPSDYLIRVQEGGFYGWPYAYIGQHPQPGFAERAPDKVKATITPDLLFEAHSSVLDLVFYEGNQFPPEYKGHAFVALRGSWNRSEPTGYKVVRVPFKDGRPEGFYEYPVSSAQKCGDALPRLQSPRMARSWSLMTRAARSGVSPTPARATVHNRIGRNRNSEKAIVGAFSVCLLLAQSGHPVALNQCPLLGVKRTLLGLYGMSANDPKRTMTAYETFHRVPAITLNATGI
jgi:hypothetical protein